MKIPIRLFVLSASLVLIATASVAQRAVIDRCKQTLSDADRIACLEAAILGRELSDGEPQAQIDPPSMEIDAGPGPEAKPEPQGIGAGQVVARTQSKEEKLERLEKAEGLIVARYDTVPYERLKVTLENGQVWQQIVGDTQKIRVDLKRNQTVDINESSFSGYRMRLNEMRRTLRVERIR